MRKLVTLRKISDIQPIPGADAIEVAIVDGWKVVVKKGEFSIGQVVVYFEIDSVLPKGRSEFEFLMSRGCKMQPTEDGSFLEGHRLRTIRLRGQVSQGLVIPLGEKDQLLHEPKLGWNSVMFNVVDETGDEYFDHRSFEDDLSDLYGVKKYEKPIPAQLAGMCRGNYPEWLPKTDQERVQNCFNQIPHDDYHIEEKFEGSSMTIYHDGEKIGVTSRNLDLILEQEGNTFVDVAKASGLFEALEVLSLFGNHSRIAIRGELIGPGIQENIYKLTSHKFMIFDIWAGDRYLTPDERFEYIEKYLAPYANKDVVTPVKTLSVGKIGDATVDDLTSQANGFSCLRPDTRREGLVFKSSGLHDGHVYSFKVISPDYLLKEAA